MVESSALIVVCSMEKKNIFLIGLVIVAIVIFGYLATNAGTKPFRTRAPGEKIQVTTSFYPLYFFTSIIVGDKASVYNITPAGAEPHDYEPTTQDLARIEDSALLILNGKNFEAWGDTITDTIKGSGTVVISVGDEFVNVFTKERGATIHDPHIWLDPLLAKKEVVVIKDTLKRVDPVNADYYERNAEELLQKLDTLDQKFSQGLKGCQKKDYPFIHGRFDDVRKNTSQRH